ncbi:MAG: twin-arginine translocase subunit TatC [Flavobacteriales bacterium]|nr:twin-arginine translocase subunit TatC [Flavobacteriales bacterium]NNK80429.1 twin-arginine translocase subunit TatC [Flavobacteriales bacterium]
MGVENQGEMSFLEHLEELRWRLIKAFVAVVIGAVVALSMKNLLFETLIFGPVKQWFPTNRFLCQVSDALCLSESASVFQALNLPTQISVYLMTGLIAGIIIAFPYIFYQVWSFVAPGLKNEERKQAKGMTFWVSLLFFLGILFGYFIIVPISVQFFLNFSLSDLVKNEFTINSYVSTVTVITLSTGILFQLPIVVMILAKLGLITPELLKKYRKHALVAILLLSAIITPPDISSQILVTFPIMLLYEISIRIAARIQKKQMKSQTKELI